MIAMAIRCSNARFPTIRRCPTDGSSTVSQMILKMCEKRVFGALDYYFFFIWFCRRRDACVPGW